MPRGQLRVKHRFQLFRGLLRSLSVHESLDDFDVPDFVEIRIVSFVRRIRFFRCAIEERDRNAVAAAIVICCVVQGLVNVADEMDYESEGIGAGLSRRV